MGYCQLQDAAPYSRNEQRLANRDGEQADTAIGDADLLLPRHSCRRLVTFLTRSLVTTKRLELLECLRTFCQQK